MAAVPQFSTLFPSSQADLLAQATLARAQDYLTSLDIPPNGAYDNLATIELALDLLARPDLYTPSYDGGEYRGSNGPLADTWTASPAECAVLLGLVLARLERDVEQKRREKEKKRREREEQTRERVEGWLGEPQRRRTRV